MVATKLSEVAGKGWEWYNSGPSAPSLQPPNDSKNVSTTPGSEISSTSTSSYWNYAQDSMQSALDQTYSTVGSMVSSVAQAYPGSPSGSVDGDSPVVENLPVAQRNSNSILTSQKLLNLFHNPYVSVRGGGRHHVEQSQKASIEAVRSFLSVVPPVRTDETIDQESEASSSHTDSLEGQARSMFWPPYNNNNDRSRYSAQHGRSSAPLTGDLHASPSETASQLAEGTLRAFRDVALDEAVELHEALRYWSYRWERPILSWLEAGPTVWFSKEGYRHQDVGWKVSQIQAVLARRCSTIGDLQQHLLRAGWQRGVAQWGVLGDGGEWATVAGVDGAMPAESERKMTRSTLVRSTSSELISTMAPHRPATSLPNAPTSKISDLPQRSRHDSMYYTNVFVQNDDGGRICFDDHALAEFAVDALSIVRQQLFRAANGKIMLPYSENWSEGDDQSLAYDPNGSVRMESDNNHPEEAIRKRLPLWASLKKSSISTVDEETDGEEEDVTNQDTQQQVTVSNLPLMAAEVSEILDSMEAIMGLQRARRLGKLRAPVWIRRNWYLGAAAFPPFAYFLVKVVMRENGLDFVKFAGQTLIKFVHEHVVEPIRAIYEELTKGTTNIADHDARNIAIENLQKMIRSWLDENHPDMPLKERYLRAEMMDIALIESKKEESMKSLYQLDSVIRMSLIEAQFLKKEMMNALLALDEMRAATNFNMNIAAVTPFVLMVYMAKGTFQFIFYATLRMGKSRQETYGSFLQILTEIERLLVMRDNPPTPFIRSGDHHHGMAKATDGSSVHVGSDTVLNADDMGMLMLHIHHLKTILWKDRRRFSPSIIRSVAEDLAELAGERGAVSVRQQLQIIGRMSRTYPFLKVVNSVSVFDYSPL